RGSAFDDYLRDNRGNNVLEGGDGNDSLYATDGLDSLYGGEGDDYIAISGRGDKQVDGGSGFDQLNYIAWGGGTAEFGQGALRSASGDSIVYAGIESLSLGYSADIIRIDLSQSSIHAINLGGGNNELHLRGGALDRATADSGADSMTFEDTHVAYVN